jgi:transcriptional regulator with XRE-family HTH domain
MAAAQKGAGQGGRGSAPGNSAAGNASAGNGASGSAALGTSAATRDQDALRAFAEELKAWRAARGWTQAELGDKVGYSESMIAQVEGCYKPPVMQMAEAFDRVFATPGYVKAEPGQEGKPGTFMRLAARIRKMSFPVAFRPFTDFEEEATALFIFEHTLFPGLFQTEDYARYLLTTYPGATPELAAQRLTARLSRQEIIARHNPPRVWVLLYEQTLRTMVDSPKITESQILRMVQASRRSNVTVQVLPSGLHAAVKGAFHIAEVNGTPTAAYTEDATDGRTTQDIVTLNTLSERFRYLQTEAMTPRTSVEFMEKVAKETWSEPYQV